MADDARAFGATSHLYVRIVGSVLAKQLALGVSLTFSTSSRSQQQHTKWRNCPKHRLLCMTGSCECGELRSRNGAREAAAALPAAVTLVIRPK